MKGSCISTTQLVLSPSVMFFSGYLLIQKGPRMCFVWTLPSRHSCALPFHPFPMPTPGPPQELQTQMCSFPFRYFTSLILNGKGRRIQARFPGFKAGSVQDGALHRGQEQQCGYPPFPPQPENWKHTSDFSFHRPNCSEEAARLGDSLTSDSSLQWVIIAEYYTALCNPY